MARRVSSRPRSGALVLDGKGSPKQRRPSPQAISETQVATFFATLEETCNVVLSAEAAGFATNWAYRKRKSDAGFRNAWRLAVREGYRRLELILLERAMNGTPKLVRTAKGDDTIMREYPSALAIALLKRHADLADEAEQEHARDEIAEVRARIVDKLERLIERDRKAKAKSKAPRKPAARIETKSALGRLELIAAALKGRP